ncbi:MAG: hypothetical protein AB9M53_09690 [Leptothrix sp. (in: b-proteobacteria)]
MAGFANLIWHASEQSAEEILRINFIGLASIGSSGLHQQLQLRVLSWLSLQSSSGWFGLHQIPQQVGVELERIQVQQHVAVWRVPASS